MDYRQWAERALAFTDGLRTLPGQIQITAELWPPLAASEVLALDPRLRLPLPKPLCDFLMQASANCRCKYWWEPPDHLQRQLLEVFPSNTFIFGGASLCDSERFEENEVGCLDTGEALQRAVPEEAKLWMNSVPFHECGNGDYIALYVGDDRPGDNFPVVYLDQDGCGGSRVLAPGFDEFLTAWEQLYYVHGAFLHFFLNPIRGTMNPRSPKKSAFDHLLRPSVPRV